MEQKRAGYLAVTGIVLLFFILALIRLYPFTNTLQQVVEDTGNDWGRYAAYALDIKNNGILMPSVDGAYEKPASFFYAYFLAACFTLFGENTVPVYLLQNLMLGLSIAFIWLTFRNLMSHRAGIAFLVALTLFGLADVSMYYTFRFLGENVAVFTLSIFFFLFSRGFEKNKLSIFAASAFFLGIAVLTRPNIFLYEIALSMLLTLYYKRISSFIQPSIFISVLVLTSSFLAIRNYPFCTCIQFMPSQGFAYNMVAFHPIPPTVNLDEIQNHFLHTKLHLDSYYAAYFEYLVQEPMLFLGHYLKKVLFCFGFLNVIVPSYHWFPHWTLMWLGYFTYLLIQCRKKAKLSLAEKAVHLFIFCYYGSLILVGQIENYGFRMLVPGNFFVLPFGVMGWEKIFRSLKKGKQQVQT